MSLEPLKQQARKHEQNGDRQSAVEYHDSVFSLDINFADVTQRLRALG